MLNVTLIPAVTTSKMQKRRQQRQEKQDAEVVMEAVAMKDMAKDMAKDALVQEEAMMQEGQTQDEEEQMPKVASSSVTLADRLNCSEGDVEPPTRVNTSMQ